MKLQNLILVKVAQSCFCLVKAFHKVYINTNQSIFKLKCPTYKSELDKSFLKYNWKAAFLEILNNSSLINRLHDILRHLREHSDLDRTGRICDALSDCHTRRASRTVFLKNFVTWPPFGPPPPRWICKNFSKELI